MIIFDRIWPNTFGNSIMILFFLSCFALSKSEKEEDLYEILGVSHHASKSEINNAFKELVRQYHPDRNPSPEAERKLMKINNAYEILKDNEKRRLYDRTGSTEFEQFDESYYSNFQDFDDFENFHSYFKQTLNSDINPINLEEFNMKINRMEKDIFLFFYSDEEEAKPYFSIINYVSVEYSGFFDFYYNVTNDKYPEFIERLEISSTPALLYIKKSENPNSEYKFEVYHFNLFLSETAFKFFLSNHFNGKVQHFRSFSKAKEWISQLDGRTKFLILERSGTPSKELRYLATKYGKMADFAFLSEDYISLIRDFKLTNLPKLFVFRGFFTNDTFKNYISMSSLDEQTIIEYSKPLFVKFTNKSALHECSDFCVVRIGNKPDRSIFKKYSELTEYGFAYLLENSTLARAIHGDDDEFYLIEGKSRKYSRISNPKKINDIVAKRNLNKLAMKHLPDDVNADKELIDDIMNRFESVKLPTTARLLISYVITIVEYLIGFIFEHMFLLFFGISIIKFIFSFIWKFICFIFCCCPTKKHKRKRPKQKIE